jgi:hypothetical protein
VFNSIQVQVFNIEHLRMTDAQARRPVQRHKWTECRAAIPRPLSESASLTWDFVKDRGRMTKPEEYRFINAQECERMAGNSLNSKDKAAWMLLAKRWLRMITTAGTGEAGQSQSGK